MNKKKMTRRALFTSVISLILCLVMLTGTTFAWFTDSETSGRNVIKSGNLDVTLEYWDGTEYKPVTTTTQLFNDSALWEPGYTEVAYLKVTNVGNLALKYQLDVNVYNETAGTNVYNEAFNLSDYLVFKVIDSETDLAGTYTRETAKTAAGIEMGLKTYNSAVKDLIKTGDADYIALIIYMPESVDNHANHKVGTEAPTIEMGVVLNATQKTSESDTFGPDYDEDATAADNVYHVTPANFASTLEAIEASDDEVVLIVLDESVEWETGAGIGSNPLISDTAKVKSLIVDANGHTITATGAGVGPIRMANGGTLTIKNGTVVDNSVSYNEGAWELTYLEFAGNLIFKNVQFTSGIMVEGENATFTNCSFESKESSVYAAWVTNGNASFTGCTFTGTRGLKTHEDYGTEVGTLTVDNCTFKDISAKPGIAIGDLNAGTNVTIKNSTFIGCQPGDQGLYIYESDTDVNTFNFVESNNKYVATAAPTTNDQLKDAIDGNVTEITLPEGNFTLPTLDGKEGINIEGTDGTVIGGADATTGFGGNFGKETTISNVDFTGSTNGVRYSYAQGGTTTFNDCTFAGDSTYGFHIDQSNGATFIFNNCTFKGFNAFASDLVKVEFNNCTFLSNGNYGHTNIWSNGYFNNCTWGDNTSVGTRGDNAHLFFNGVEESYHHEYIGSADSLVAFAESVNNDGDTWDGQKVLLVDDIDLAGITWTPIGQTGATIFKGIFDGQNHTISNLTIDSSAQTGGNYSSGLFGWAESGVTIQNVKVDGATVKGNHNVAVIVGYTYSGTVSNCHVTNANIVCTHANDDACGDKCGLIAGYAGDESRFTNCSGSNSSVKAGRDAGQLIGAGYNGSVSGCSATNVTVIANGDCTGANINNAVIGRVLG